MIFFLIPRVFKYFIFSFFEGWFVSVGEFFYNLLASEGVLSSLQFGFTALLTLLVPLLIEVYKDQESTDALDKTIQNKVVGFNFQWRFLNLKGPNLIAYITILFILFQFLNLPINALFSSCLIVLLFLKTLHIIDFTLDKDKYKENEIRTSKNQEILEYFENYFLTKSKTTSNKYFERQKSFNQEKKFVTILFEKIDKLDFTKDAKFAADLVQVFLSGFENVNFEIFFYEGWILDKLLEWHKKGWWIYYTEIIKNDKDNINLHNNSYLQRVLMDLINKILEKSLTSAGLSSHIFSKLIKKIDKHIEENGELTVEKKVANQLKKYHYINNQNFDFHNTLLNNLHKSNFLREIKSENSEYYFPQKWIITESRNLINNYWLEILFNHWLFEKLHWGNLTDGFNEETKEQIKAVIQVFFRGVRYDWLVETILYWRMFLPTKMFVADNLKRKDKIKTLLNVNLFYLEFTVLHGKVRNYIGISEKELTKKLDEDFKNDIKELTDKTIKLILQLFPEVKNNITQDLKEIKTLKKDKTLTDTQKRRLQIIEQIWQEIKALKTKT